MKKNFHALGKRALALLIVLTMCVSLLQVTAFAAPGEETTAESVAQQQAEAEKPAKTEDTAGAESTDKTEVKTEDPAETESTDKTEVKTEDPAETESTDKTEVETEDTTGAESTDKTEVKTEDPAETESTDKTEVKTEDTTQSESTNKTEPVVVTKPAAPADTVMLPSSSNVFSYVFGMLNEVASKCPKCGAGTYTKGDYTGCTVCNWSMTQTTPAEPEKHVHEFDATGKCECGAQHEHDWKYKADIWHEFTHVKYCSGCDASETEFCPTEQFDYFGTPAVRCSLGCGWRMNAEDVHHWPDKWEPNGEGSHTQKCTDSDCNKDRTEECKLVASQDHSSVVCSVCGWIKYNDGTPGDIGETCKDGHTFSNSAKPNGSDDGVYYHTLYCTVCKQDIRQRCELKNLLGADGKPVAYYCDICGQQTSLKGSDYCVDGKSHDYQETNQVFSEDGKSVLTTQTCKICGFVKIQEICHSPSTVIVHYVYEDGKQALPDSTTAVIAGMNYLINSPTIEGYEPDKAVVAGTCTDGKGAEYTVTYKKAAETYTLTIHYQKPGGETVFPDKILQLKADEEYSVPSPKLHGYTPEWETVSGKMPNRVEVVTVKYTPTEYKWTIKYVDENDKELAETYETTYTVENVKSLTVPENPKVEGYKVKFENQGMPDSEKLGNVEGKVVYMPESIPTYTLTIKYEFPGGEEVFPAYTAQLEKNEPYTVPSPELLGYTPEQAVVSGTMPAADEKITVKYTLDQYTWTIHYVDENGNTLFNSVVTDFNVTNIKSLGSVTSPTQKGYTADQPVVNAPTKLDNVEVTVKYTLSADFNLTVIHRYVNRDGTVIEVTQDMVKHQIGDQYTTQPVARSGYTLSATPENATGVFGAQDVTVTYVYTANAPSGGNNGGGTPPVTPNPPEEPNPPVGPDDPIEVPDDPNVPLEPGPGTDDPQEPGPGDDVIIDDPNVPLAPGPDIPDVDIDDPDVPMTNKPTAPAEKNPVPQPTATGLTEIEDEDVPLAEVPQTGDNTGLWIAAAILAACGLVTLGKKREDA